MITKTLTINDEIGFHVRTASMFANIANSFSSDIKIKFKEKTANGKSTLSIMTLGVSKGNKIDLIIEGVDAKYAIRELQNLIKNNFSI